VLLSQTALRTRKHSGPPSPDDLLRRSDRGETAAALLEGIIERVRRRIADGALPGRRDDRRSGLIDGSEKSRRPAVRFTVIRSAAARRGYLELLEIAPRGFPYSGEPSCRKDLRRKACVHER